MPDITNLATKAVLNTKAIEMENKITSINDQAIIATLNTKTAKIEDTMSDSSNFFDTHKSAKISLDARMVEASKNFATENQGNAAFNLEEIK